MIFELFSWAGQQHCPVSENENERHLCLVAQTFTKQIRNKKKINSAIKHFKTCFIHKLLFSDFSANYFLTKA